MILLPPVATAHISLQCFCALVLSAQGHHQVLILLLFAVIHFIVAIFKWSFPPRRGELAAVADSHPKQLFTKVILRKEEKKSN